MMKSGFSAPPLPNSESRSAAGPADNSTLPLRPARARLRLWSRAKVGLISHARIRASGHLAASRKVRAPLPAPSSMTCPRYAAGTGAIIFAMRKRCEGTMPPVCPCFTRPAQKKCRYVAAVLDIVIISLAGYVVASGEVAPVKVKHPSRWRHEGSSNWPKPSPGRSWDTPGIPCTRSRDAQSRPPSHPARIPTRPGFRAGN